MITILFFAQLREQLACEQLLIDAPTPISVLDLRALLIDIHPHWASFLGSDKLLFAVNQTLVKSAHPIVNGDEVAFFPPVTGG